MLLALSLAAHPAFAGSGPWTLPEGDVAVYAGAEFERIGHLAASGGSFDPDAIVAVDSGLEKASGQLILGYGVHERVDVELQLPYTYAAVNREDGAVCTTVLSLYDQHGCDTTHGLGIVTARAKGLLVDELTGAPLSLGLGTELRFGQTTNATRSRVTNLGEGTNDVGGFVDVGRSGGLGQGYWSGFVEVGGRYRFPNTESKTGAPVPGSEFHADAEWLGGLRTWWAVGPAVSFFWRPEGVDFEAIDPTDVDRFATLRVMNVRAGGKLIVRSSERTSLALAAFGTAFAMNNPSDQVIVTAGLSGQLPSRAQPAEP
jgi:hypothetical protein